MNRMNKIVQIVCLYFFLSNYILVLIHINIKFLFLFLFLFLALFPFYFTNSFRILPVELLKVIRLIVKKPKRGCTPIPAAVHRNNQKKIKKNKPIISYPMKLPQSISIHKDYSVFFFLQWIQHLELRYALHSSFWFEL